MYHQRRSTGPVPKPEILVKRADVLISSAIGTGDKEKSMALKSMHDALSQKNQNWSKEYELMMKKHIQLCVDLRDYSTAKDGLHQYRNLCQSEDLNLLEPVVKFLLDICEKRLADARAQADKVNAAAEARGIDQGFEESPESIMMSTMTEEKSKDRVQSELVQPWIQFVRECYRATQDILSRIPKLKKLYQSVSERYFRMFAEFRLPKEFRNLSEILRAQLQQQRTPQQKKHMRGDVWELDSETIEVLLQIRFTQLEVATTLQLWTEAFKTIEDINGVMNISATPKAKFMITYYERLTKIFWAVDNKLLHAYAWMNLYNSTVEGKRDLKAEDKSLMATNVLVAALAALPSVKEIYSAVHEEEEDEDEDEEEDEDEASHVNGLNTIVDFQRNPSRHNLLTQIVNRGLLPEIRPEVSKLYSALELNFSPLTLVKTVAAIFTDLEAQPSLAQYVEPLQKIVVIKLMQQLSRVYSTVKLDFVFKLLAPLSSLTPVAIEKIVLESITNKHLQMKISHATASIQFASNTAAMVAADAQVSALGTSVAKISRAVESATENKKDAAAVRSKFFANVKAVVAEQTNAIMRRNELIDEKRQQLEQLQQEKLVAEQKALEAEAKRLANVAAEKKAAEIAAANALVKDRTEAQNITKELIRLGKNVEESKIVAMDSAARHKMLREAQEAENKQKDLKARKEREEAKNLDYRTRALRMNSKPAVERLMRERKSEDDSYRNDVLSAALTKWNTKHKEILEQKPRLLVLSQACEAYDTPIIEDQRERHSGRFLDSLLEKARRQATIHIEAARKLAREERARQEALANERARQEEEERQEKMRRQLEELELAKQRQQEQDRANARNRDMEMQRMRDSVSEESSRYPARGPPRRNESAADSGNWRDSKPDLPPPPPRSSTFQVNRGDRGGAFRDDRGDRNDRGGDRGGRGGYRDDRDDRRRSGYGNKEAGRADNATSWR